MEENALKISTRKHDENIQIVDIGGQIDASNAMVFEEELDKVIVAGANRLILNFKELEFISSAGLRVILALIKKLQTQSGEIKICHLNANITKVFNLAGFTQIMRILHTEADSIKEYMEPA